MQINIKVIFEQKLYLVLFLLFTLGAYAFMQSVLTRGEIQYVAKNVEIPSVNEVKAVEEPNFITPEVLGDKVFNNDNFFGGKQPKVVKKLENKPKVSILTDENEVPKIVLGYKEGLNEAWDICSDIELAKSFGFDTSSCQLDNNSQIASNITFGNGGGGNNISDSAEEVVIPEIVVEEPLEENNPVYASSSQAILDSFKIGGQEVIGKIGSEPMSRTETSYKSGAILEVADPYSFTGIILQTTPVSQIIVYTFNDHWSTWELNYPGTAEALADLVLQDRDTVIVKIISEDNSTTNWYKAKVFATEESNNIPAFLTTFKVGGIDVLPLTGLVVDHSSMNSVDFGATLPVPDFSDFKGIEVAVNDWNNFIEAKVLIYSNYWTTWDLLYEGALADLVTAPLTEGDMVVLKLKDQENNSFWYRVNLVQGQIEEATEFSQNNPQEEIILNADSSLKDLLISDHSIDLETANVGPVWTPTSTGAVLMVESFDNLVGVMPTASDLTSTVKVQIFRDYWITWEYPVGLDLVAKEPILSNDRIVIEVTALDDTKTYYQVQVTLKTEVENSPVQASPESVSADEAIKPEQVEELKPENTDNDDNDKLEPATAERGHATGGKEKVEIITEKISTDSQISTE